MGETIRTAAISPLRQRLIDDMNMRRFSRETQRNYICDVGRFAAFLRRSPDTATADDLRRFQIEQRDAGVPTPTMNSIVSVLRFFFTTILPRLALWRCRRSVWRAQSDRGAGGDVWLPSTGLQHFLSQHFLSNVLVGIRVNDNHMDTFGP
jgi:hypothetical protein